MIIPDIITSDDKIPMITFAPQMIVLPFQMITSTHQMIALPSQMITSIPLMITQYLTLDDNAPLPDDNI